MDALNDISRILTARVNVPSSTLPRSPVSKVIRSPLPILDEFKAYKFSASGAVTEIESGFSVFVGGVQIVPTPGSVDDLTNEPWASVPSSFAFESGEINQQLSGPPFDIEFRFYNTDGAAAVYYFIIAKVSPKIHLPVAAITADENK